MRTLTLRLLWLGCLFLSLAGLVSLPAIADEGDPPARVARLSVIQGKLSFQPAGENQWSEVSLNRTVSTGDRLYTDEQSRAELEVGSYSVRLSQFTDLTVANLNDQILQLGLGQGSIRVSIYGLPPGETVEIDTPNGALTIQRPGAYRVDTSQDGNSTQVTVNRGSLEVSGGDLHQAVDAGQSVQLTGTGPIQASLVSAPGPDDFDHWSADRDRRIEQYRSAQYVSRDVPGCEDLDEHGVWQENPQYGHVWVPSVGPGWIPYRAGHWAWIEPWGWTWVDDAPWGFVPFHYGRWAHLGPVWFWVPGPVVVRPVYAPALVAFVGGGGFRVGIGVQAWFPLGPREPYVPWYHYGPTYLNQVNVTNVRNVTNITNITNVTNINNITYVNKTVATTAVSGEVFRGGRPVSQGLVQVNQQQLAQARVVEHPDVAPARTAVFGGRNTIAPPPHLATVPMTTQARNGPTTFTRTLPNQNLGAGHSGPPAGGSGGATPMATVPKTTLPANNRFGGPPNNPAPRFITKNPTPNNSVDFSKREPALAAHPGRPLEPQQMENLKKGQSAGPMKDKEVFTHAPKNSAAKPAPKDREDRGKNKR